ncbi:MAG: hypothetical protein SH847_15930, partial [Roseiflexaceae bacterium]|nr:hypothetical protein [Roseiflexaceae bacterium]
ERIERLKTQARQAAAEGVSGALEAVERALAGIAIPTPPTPPTPPVAPMAPTPPVPPVPPVAPVVAHTSVSADSTLNVPVVADVLIDAPQPLPATGVTVKITPAMAGEHAAPSASLEEQRATILRLVAEGRITPEEGDLLLESLA